MTKKNIDISIGQMIGSILGLLLLISGFFLTSFFTETKALAQQVTTMNTDIAIQRQGIKDIKSKMDYLVSKIDTFTSSYQKDEMKITQALNSQISALDKFMRELTLLYSRKRR